MEDLLQRAAGDLINQSAWCQASVIRYLKILKFAMSPQLHICRLNK